MAYSKEELLHLVSKNGFNMKASDEKELKSVTKTTPITDWIDAENQMLDTMNLSSKEVFFIMRNKHSVIRTIEVVRRDIQKAVKACGKENKGLKNPMRDRLKDWENAVNPIIKNAREFLETELKEQEAFHLTDYRHVMRLNDKAFRYSDSKVEKTVVTTPEACQGLLDSMDRTEDELIRLLQEILLPEEVIRKRLKPSEKPE